MNLDELLAGSGLTEGQRQTAKDQLIKLKEQRWNELIIVKLSGNKYRLKRGRVRIFYEKLPRGKFKVLWRRH